MIEKEEAEMQGLNARILDLHNDIDKWDFIRQEHQATLEMGTKLLETVDSTILGVVDADELASSDNRLPTGDNLFNGCPLVAISSAENKAVRSALHLHKFELCQVASEVQEDTCRRIAETRSELATCSSSLYFSRRPSNHLSI
jgi:hypothetical protein